MHINEMGTEVGLPPEMCAEYAEVNARYAAALAAASNPTTRTRGSVSTKNDCRKLLKRFARKLSRIVQAHPDTTNQQRIMLGLSVRQGGGGSPVIAAPQQRPGLQILHTMGRRVRVQLWRAGTSARGREPGASTATIFSFVGENAPADLRKWTFEMTLSKTNFDLEMHSDVPPGSKVWLAAIWSAPTGAPSPMSMPASTYIGDGVAKAA
jgi:hypothetical protein